MAHFRHSASTTVSTTRLQLLPANPARTTLIVQETGGTNDIRFSDEYDNLASTVGIWLKGGDTIILQDSACPTGAIWAVAEVSGDATVSATER